VCAARSSLALMSSEAAAAAPAPRSSMKFVIALPIVLLLNHVMTTIVDESGLHVVMLTGELPGAGSDASAHAKFIADAELAGSTMHDISGSDALRFELMEQRNLPPSADPLFTAVLVHRQHQEAPALPAWMAERLTVQSMRRFTTVFPERSRWKESPPQQEAGELGEVGRVALLVQLTRMVVQADAAESLRLGWADLGYNALGELGVVRCDLMLEVTAAGDTGDAAAPVTYVARKVFRNARALEDHQATEHYQRWHQATMPLLQGAAQTELLDTLHPRSSPYPFRTRWA